MTKLLEMDCRDCAKKPTPLWKLAIIHCCLFSFLICTHYLAFWVGKEQKLTITMISSGNKARIADKVFAEEEKRIRRNYGRSQEK